MRRWFASLSELFSQEGSQCAQCASLFQKKRTGDRRRFERIAVAEAKRSRRLAIACTKIYVHSHGTKILEKSVIQLAARELEHIPNSKRKTDTGQNSSYKLLKNERAQKKYPVSYYDSRDQKVLRVKPAVFLSVSSARLVDLCGRNRQPKGLLSKSLLVVSRERKDFWDETIDQPKNTVSL